MKPKLVWILAWNTGTAQVTYKYYPELFGPSNAALVTADWAANLSRVIKAKNPARIGVKVVLSNSQTKECIRLGYDYSDWHSWETFMPKPKFPEIDIDQPIVFSTWSFPEKPLRKTSVCICFGPPSRSCSVHGVDKC